VFAAVDRDGGPGHEHVGQDRQRRGRDVVGPAGAPGRIGRGPGLEQRGLAFVSESVVRACVDGSRGDGIDPDRGEFDRQPGDDGVDWDSSVTSTCSTPMSVPRYGPASTSG
jgi:hypothetical protein